MNNNKGYSLTELLLAIFVLSIVMLGIAGIMRSTSQFYRNGTQEVRVQEEAQLAVNLIEEMLVDADADNASQRPSWDATTERLSFYNEEGKHINITYQHPTGDPKGQLLMGYWENPDDSGNYIVETLADYVTGFEVSGIDYDTSHDDADNRIKVSVSMDNDGYTYTASKEIYMRNLVENNTISISTVPSGGGGGSTWDAEVLLNRYETYNLTTWFNADPTGTPTFIGDFEQYFDSNATTDSLVVSVDTAYCSNYSAASTNSCGISFPIIGGGTKKVRFYYEAVDVVLSPNADIFVYPNSSSNMTGQGVSTLVEVKGINVNKALQASGATVTADISLNGESKSYTLSAVDKASEGDKKEFNQNGNGKLLIGVSSDPCSNGVLILACNGGFPDQYTHGQGSNMTFKLKITPTSPSSGVERTLTYKFRIGGNVL